MKRHIILLFFCSAFLHAASDMYQQTSEFLHSFIQHYDCMPEGRFVHEYHPYLLQKTADSFGVLEQRLADEGFTLHGRIGICGYEEGAVPSYYTDFCRSRINDEGRVRGQTAEWSLIPHNRFGVMTGYIFKDCSSDSPLFSHIDADQIQVFNPHAAIFQEHAFGDALPLMHKAYQLMARAIIKQDSGAALKILTSFWESMHRYALNIGNKQRAGTQDILFSIAYARYLQQAKTAVKRFFIGPDITYPIEVSCRQKEEATRHAQHFVREFTKELVSLDGQTTAYIFGSFVDGVGKSTTLGNVKNVMRFGNNIAAYQHVDNSSSQFSEVFQFADGVFIADLPAQLSHFTYKPDGLVYVDADAQISAQLLAECIAVVEQKKNTMLADYQALLGAVQHEIQRSGFFAPSLQDAAQPERIFVRNLVLLKRLQANVWVPFTCHGMHCLFNSENKRQIRVLVPLEKVRSEGLKNIESEQMLFDGGIKFPAHYGRFLDDLVAKLKTAGVQRVIFVDFLSMYSRSPRENPRINYLLQQLALIDASFDPHYSLYHHFTHGAELLAYLLDDKTALQVTRGLVTESVVRAGLFSLLEEGAFDQVTSVSPEVLTQRIKAYLQDLPHELEELAANNFVHKIEQERIRLNDMFGLSKRYINVMQTNVKLLVRFSHMLAKFFYRHTNMGPGLEELWQDTGYVEIGTEQEGGVVTTSTGEQCVAKARIPMGCTHEPTLAPMMRMLRACWYAALSNLFSCRECDGKLTAVVPLRAPTIPLFFQPGLDRHLYVLQRRFDPFEGDIDYRQIYAFDSYNLLSHEPADFVSIQDLLFRANWASKDTCTGFFQADVWITKEREKSREELERPINDLQDAIKMLPTLLVRRHQAQHGADQVLPMSEFYKQLKKTRLWSHAQAEVMQGSTADIAVWKDSKKPHKIKYLVVPDFMYPVLQTYVRLLATLDMVVKDPEANVVIRFGNRDDFSAAVKVIEKMLFPRYQSAFAARPLFDNYKEVQPYPSWEYWERP